MHSAAKNELGEVTRKNEERSDVQWGRAGRRERCARESRARGTPAVAPPRRSTRVAGAFSAQMGNGAAQELDDRRKAQAAGEAGMGRLVQAAKEASGGS